MQGTGYPLTGNISLAPEADNRTDNPVSFLDFVAWLLGNSEFVDGQDHDAFVLQRRHDEPRTSTSCCRTTDPPGCRQAPGMAWNAPVTFG